MAPTNKHHKWRKPKNQAQPTSARTVFTIKTKTTTIRSNGSNSSSSQNQPPPTNSFVVKFKPSTTKRPLHSLVHATWSMSFSSRFILVCAFKKIYKQVHNMSLLHVTSTARSTAVRTTLENERDRGLGKGRGDTGGEGGEVRGLGRREGVSAK